MSDTPQPAPATVVMVGVPHHNYAMLDGTVYTADAEGLLRARAAHKLALLHAGCDLPRGAAPNP
jgi:hypothetical protein